jgi:hypothetical protein
MGVKSHIAKVCFLPGCSYIFAVAFALRQDRTAIAIGDYPVGAINRSYRLIGSQFHLIENDESEPRQWCALGSRRGSLDIHSSFFNRSICPMACSKRIVPPTYFSFFPSPEIQKNGPGVLNGNRAMSVRKIGEQPREFAQRNAVASGDLVLHECCEKRVILEPVASRQDRPRLIDKARPARPIQKSAHVKEETFGTEADIEFRLPPVFARGRRFCRDNNLIF